MTNGNSDTFFGVNLSPSAVAADHSVNNRPDCSADSASGSTNVYTYMIHQSESPLTLSMTQGEPGALPDGSPTLALFDSNGTIETNPTGPYGNTQSTFIGTGQINLPPTQQFQWGQITASSGGSVPLTGASGLLYQTNSAGNPTGAWHGGYLCYKGVGAGGAYGVTDYWGFTITFTKDATNGGSQGFTWTVQPDQPPSGIVP